MSANQFDFLPIASIRHLQDCGIQPIKKIFVSSSTFLRYLTRYALKADSCQERNWESLSISSIETPPQTCHQPNSNSPFSSLEPHYSVQMLAELWRLDNATVRRIFETAPGVLRLGDDKRGNGKRGYFTLRIPASVAEREHRRMTSVASETAEVPL